MNAIRSYANKVGHEIIGKLTRHPEHEWKFDGFSGDKIRTKEKFYMDEGGNEYWVSKTGVTIIDADGGVI